MPILKQEDIEDSNEQRHAIVEKLFVTKAPSIPGFQCVRHMTPLVMVALQRANNPYLTNRKGFESIGVEFDAEGKQVTDSVQFAIAMMPKTAEVLVLLSCSNDELKSFVSHPDELASSAMDLVDESDMDTMAEATMFVAEQLQAISKSRAAISDSDKKPESKALKEGAGTPKKRHRTG